MSTPAPALADAEAAVTAARQRLHDYRQQAAYVPRQPDSPEEQLKEAEQRLLVAKGAIRKEIIAQLTATRADLAREYLLRAQEFMSIFFRLAAADALLAKLVDPRASRLSPTFHTSLAIPFPGYDLLPPTIAPHVNDHGTWIDPGCSRSPEAAQPIIVKQMYNLEKQLREAAQAWPFNP